MEDREMADLYKLLAKNKPVRCERCDGKMSYVFSGKYKCSVCGYETLDDFGKIKEFLEEYGPSSAAVISRATGVHSDVIEMLLKKGKVEIPEGSDYYLKCEKCGCSIRYGRYCPSCVKGIAGGIKTAFHEEVGERPKYEVSSEMSGKMHFLNRK